MKKSFLTMLEADENMVLVKDNNYCKSVLLRKDETEDGWGEITEEEYNEIMKAKGLKND